MSDAPLRPALDRLTAVMIVVALLTLSGGYLLLSAAESLTLVDGAVEWQAESPLRAVVQLLCLNYQFPTILAGDIKGYVLNMGVVVGLAALGIAALARSRDAAPFAAPHHEQYSFIDDSETVFRLKRRFPLSVAAQFLAVLYVLWAFAGVRWSQAADIAVAGSTWLAIQFLWALVLANALGAVGVRHVLRGFLVVTLLTSLVAVWYYYGRNPTLRAKFPFGNPTFLSACLIPGITLALAWICHAISQSKLTRAKSSFLWAVVAVCALAAGLWAFRLTGSRGAQVGLGAAVLSGIFFAVRGRWRIVPVVLTFMFGIAAWFLYIDDAQTSLTGRGDSLRLRGYAWSHALKMFADRPFTGHGQGGYALLGDSFVANDIENDPLVFDGRLDHAHNEWLEILSDLGVVGATLIVAVLVLTLIGVGFSLRNCDSEHRWCLIGLVGSLVGLVIEECSGVGLRLSEVPVAFYTVLGLTWAGATTDRFKVLAWTSQGSWRGLGLGVLCLAGGLGVMSVTQLDFQSDRRSFEIQQFQSQGKTDETVQLADQGLWRLSPSRSLFSRYQIADTYVRWGERTIQRAAERKQRAEANVDARLLELAGADLAAAQEAIRMGGHALKELVERSPGYINSGLLDYRINYVHAQAAVLRNDLEAAEASRKNAVAALERELLRQPFQSYLGNAYSRFASPDIPKSRVLTVLARPLRYELITEETAHSLQQLAQSAETQDVLARSLSAVRSPEPSGGGDIAIIDAKWSPELFRMSAALNFMRGQYENATSQLNLAAQRYAALPRPPTLGEAAAHLERAEALFYANPDVPEAALADANRAIELAPHSRLGREFQTAVRQRMIQYYLAADHEEEARALLKQSTPSRVAEELVTRELGTRLRKLSESLLLQRREAMILRKPADTLLPRLERWLNRAIELNPADFAARFIAADLALHSGNDVVAANHLRQGLDAGLDPVDAARFLQMALERAPDSAALKSLAAELQSQADLASDKKEP